MNIAILLAGGVGKRLMSSIPKQYTRVCDRMMITYALETLAVSQEIQGIQIVADPDWKEAILEDAIRYGIPADSITGFSRPGRTRQSSIYNGLSDIAASTLYREDDEDAYVLIHDAARPLLSKEQLSQCFMAAKGHDGAMPVLPMKDTVYLSEDGKQVDGLLDRTQLFAGQAPELFRLNAYIRANEMLLPDAIDQINGSTEPAVKAGMDVVMFPGDEDNFKVTTDTDLQRFRRIIEERG